MSTETAGFRSVYKMKPEIGRYPKWVNGRIPFGIEEETQIRPLSQMS